MVAVAHLGHAELRVTDMEGSRRFFTDVLGLYPFVVGDVLKLYLAGLALPLAWRLVDRIQP